MHNVPANIENQDFQQNMRGFFKSWQVLEYIKSLFLMRCNLTFFPPLGTAIMKNGLSALRKLEFSENPPPHKNLK